MKTANTEDEVIQLEKGLNQSIADGQLMDNYPSNSNVIEADTVEEVGGGYLFKWTEL